MGSSVGLFVALKPESMTSPEKFPWAAVSSMDGGGRERQGGCLGGRRQAAVHWTSGGHCTWWFMLGVQKRSGGGTNRTHSWINPSSP